MNMKINKALTFGVGLMLAGSISVNAQKVSFNGEQVSLKRKHSKKCTFYTLRFGCSFAAVNTIKPQLL